MTNYRRTFVLGATYFFTVNLAMRCSLLLVNNIEQLRAAFRYARLGRPFTIEAIAVLPDHLHAIWTLPDGDADFPLRWRLVKGHFSRNLEGEIKPVSRSRRLKGERGVWQRRYWEHLIRDDDDFVRHIDYIHFNPVKHGHAAASADWPYSSFHRFVRLGMYPAAWASSVSGEQNDYGERR